MALRVLGTLLTLGVLLFLGLRVALPHIDQFRPQIAKLIGGFMGQTVSITALEGEWRGLLTVGLSMQGVRLLDESGEETILELERARLTIDPLSSFLKGRILPGDLTVEGARIAIIREPDGTFAAQGLDETQSTLDATLSADAPRDTYAQWILTQEALRLESATIIWHDRRRGRAPVTLTDVRLKLAFDGTRHSLIGAARLPDNLGDRLGFNLDLLGDPLSRDWSGTVGLQADAIDLFALAGVHKWFSRLGAAGQISLDIDTDWAKTQLIASQGDYTIRNASLLSRAGLNPIEQAEGHFRLQRLERGWRLEVEQSNLTSSHGAWPPTQAQLEFEAGEQPEDAATLRGEFGFVRIEDVLPLVAKWGPENLPTQLSRLPLHGDLENLAFVATLDQEEVQDLTFETDVLNAGTPALSGLSGHLQGDLAQGRFEIEARDLAMDFPAMFTNPVRLSHAQGPLTWRRRGTGWWLETEGLQLSHAHVSGELAGKLHWPYGNSLPILDMGLAVESANLKHLPEFLPVGILRPRFAAWLLRAVKSGYVRDAELRFRGYAGDYPYQGAEDSFNVNGNLVDVELDYSPRWPSISDFQASFEIHDTRLELQATGGSVFDSVIESGSAIIDKLDVTRPVLNLQTQVAGSAEDGIRFLQEGTLKDRFGTFAASVKLAGNIKVNLDLTMPLPKGKRKVQGSIALLQNTVALQGIGTAFEALEGAFEFSGGGLSASNLQARYLDSPVSIDVSRSPDKPGSTEVTLRGSSDKAFLIRQLHAIQLFADPRDPPRVLNHVHGSTDWEAIVDFPDRWGQKGEEAKLHVESSLVGLHFDLPPPFDKPKSEPSQLVVETTFSSSPERAVSIRYGAEMGGRFELTSNSEGFLLKRGALVFGDPSPPLPPSDGLYVGGGLDALSIDRWLEVVTEPDPAQTEPADYPILRVLKEVEIRTTELELLGNVFAGAHLTLARDAEQRWATRVSGDSVAGKVVFPHADEQDAPVVIALEKLVLSAIDETTERPRYDPRRFPPLKFSSRSVIYDDVNVGTVKFSSTPHEDGLSVDSLYVLADGFEASAVGSWTLEDSRHRSQFVTELHADELNKLLRVLDHSKDAASGGATDILLNLDWAGSPAQFSLASASGVVHLRSNRGRLLDVKPGATGRLVGFLIMTSLPRRLKLDFSDLYGEGIVYDLIEGSFAIENGHAYTNNLIVESETARIEVAGRTGLINEDYDQVVTVTPKLASSLPLAPVWLIEKVFKKKGFDKAFAYQYTITGSWDDPVIERIAVDGESKSEDEQAER